MGAHPSGWLLLGCLGGVVSALPPRVCAAAQGTVVYQTSSHSYLDVGSVVGVAVGMRLQGCVVEAVSERSSVCRGGKHRQGARLRLPKRLEPQAVGAQYRRRTAAPVLTAAEKLSAARTLRRARHEIHAYVGRGGGAGQSSTARLELEQSSSATVVDVRVDATQRTFLDARLGVSLRLAGTPYLPENAVFDLRVDTLVRLWTPAGRRYRPGEDANVFPTALAVHLRPPHSPYRLSVGRFRPRRIPGLSLLDGAVAGYRSGSVEVGAFAGWLPTVVELAPLASRSTAGVYAHSQLRLGRQWLAAPALRLNWLLREGRSALGAEVRGDLDWHGQQSRRLRLSASARVGSGLNAGSSWVVESLRLDFVAHPLANSGFSMHGGLRVHGSRSAFGAFVSRAEDSRWRVADFALRYRLASGLRLGLGASGGQIITPGEIRTRLSISPTIGLARGLPWRGDLSLGMVQNFGQERGGIAYLRLRLQPVDRWLLGSTLSGSLTAPKKDVRGRQSLYGQVSLTAPLPLQLGLEMRLGTALSRLSSLGLVAVVRANIVLRRYF